MKNIVFLYCCIFLIGCIGNKETKTLNDESTSIVDTSVNSNNEINYTNVYVGSEEDISSGPCCVDSEKEEESSDVVDDFIFPDDEEDVVDDFTFRGEGDCTGRCREDIRACYAKFRQEIIENWHNPNGDIDSCRLYSCGSFGMAYFKRGKFLTWNYRDWDRETDLVREVNWGRERQYWYSRVVPQYNTSFSGEVLISYPGGHLCHVNSSSDDPCIQMNFSYDGRSFYYGTASFSRTDGLNAEIGDESTLFSDVFSCDNIVDWVLPTSRYINDNYSGCELDEWGNMNCSIDDLERGYDKCVDGIDNDGDGLIDCDDSNCSDDILNVACN